MISHSLNDDDTVTIRDGIKTLTASMGDVVALAYAIIDDLDPTGEASPVSRFINPGMKGRPGYNMQKLAILQSLKGGRKTARYLADAIDRPVTHTNIQLISLEKAGRVKRHLIPARQRRFEWEITDLGKHWLLVN
jgi:hypothetical protein